MLVFADESAVNMFEVKQDILLQDNLFSMMIPYSYFYLNKVSNGSIFSSLSSGPKTFSYTMYSKKAFSRYLRSITATTKKNQNERRTMLEKQRMSPCEESLLNEDNAVYFKYLKTLTSSASLIKVKLQNLLSPSREMKIEIKEEHGQETSQFGFTGAQEEEYESAILLVTRKSRHIQRFRYSLMEKHDERIIEMEKRVTKKVEKMYRLDKSRYSGQLQESGHINRLANFGFQGEVQ